MTAPARAPRSGFTLVEMAIVISLTMIIALVMVPPLMVANDGHRRTRTRSALLTEGRTALERLLRELREMDLSPLDSSAPDLSYADDGRIDFADLSYVLSSGSLQRSQDGGSSWQVACDDVGSLVFSYADETDSVLAATPLSASDRAAVRRVAVVLGLASEGETVTLQSGVYLRRFAYGGS